MEVKRMPVNQYDNTTQSDGNAIDQATRVAAEQQNTNAVQDQAQAAQQTATPHDATRVQLPAGTQANETELVVISLSLGEKQCRWIQIAPISGFQPHNRDRALMARFLDTRTFLAWIRSMLDDSVAGDGGGDWNSRPSTNRAAGKNGDLDLWVPSLEQALKAWVRDPEQLSRVDNILARYLDSMREPQHETRTEEEKQALNAVGKVWSVIRRELLGLRRTNTGSQI
jgi:hypothetical protein